MKTKKYILFALVALLTASCHDDGNWGQKPWEQYDPTYGIEANGNQNLRATNPKSIADVKAMFSKEISGGSLRQVTEPLQIQGIVVGNDEGGNIYQSLYIQDATGAISISISQAGLYGPFSIGQAVLIELEGLYVGGYGQQPQIGTIYENPKNGNIQTGRMSRYEWMKHYKLLEELDDLKPTPIAVTSMAALDLEKDCCKLITLKNVELTAADGKAVFAPSDGSVTLTSNCANRDIKGMNNVVVRTSTYAKFANAVMPTGKVDITGIASRFNNTWQILMRTDKDIKVAQ